MQFSKADFQTTPGPSKADFVGTSAQKPTFSKSDFPSAASQTQSPSSHLPPSLHPDVQTAIDQAAQQRGIPVWALRAIGRMETGGQAHPETAVSPAGAVGAMQLIPSTFQSVMPKGNILNLRDNVAAGASYYQTLLKKYGDPVKAAGAYNAGPGAFDAYLAGKGSLSLETVNYMAQVAAMHTPIEETPLPPYASDFGKPSTSLKLPQKRLPTQERTNLNPEKARYEWYDQLFGHQDLPFILDNAKLADEILPGAGHTQKALRLYATNPAAAAAEYGDNARSMLLLQAEMSDEQVKNEPILAAHRENARLMLAHPELAAGQTALEEFFNPMSWVEGGALGRGLGLAGQALNASRAGRLLLHAASPYREIVAQHGVNARNMLWQTGARMSQGSKLAKEAVDKFFGNMTQAEQWEVVRQSQGSAPNAAHAAKQPEIARRAADLRAHVIDLSTKKVAGGVLKPSQIKDVNLYFPMRGTANSPIYNDETMSFLDAVRPNVRYSGPGPTMESLHHAKYDTFDQAVARTVAPVDPTKVNAASQYYRFVKASHQNLAFEQGLRDMATKHPDMIRFGTLQGDHLIGPAPVDKWGREMVNVAKELGGTPSPGLQRAWVSRELAQFLTRGKAASTITGWSDDAAIRGMHTLVEKINDAQRAFIIANPGFHPFWNIAPNTSAATDAGLFETMRNYGRAVVGTTFSVADLVKHIPGITPEEEKIIERTPDLFRYQRATGEPEISTLRGGTFFARDKNTANLYKTDKKNPLGGPNLIERASAGKKVLQVEGEENELAYNALDKFGIHLEDLGSENLEKTLVKYGVPPDEAKTLSYEHFSALDRLASEVARKAGYDAIQSDHEFFALHPSSHLPLKEIVKTPPHPVNKLLSALERRFWVGSQEYAHDLADAISAGAEAHFGPGSRSALGGDAVRLRTLARSELKGPEIFDRFLANLSDWNTHATFGPRGEGQFVATLYKNRRARGLAPEDAAWQVRQALGHYQNVDPNAWQSKFILFYPWLKSNVPHWLLNFLGNPKLARAQVESFHRQNEERGDPRINDPMNRRNPSQLYLGRDAQGRETTWTPPFPWKDAEKVGEMVAPGGDDLNKRLQTGEEMVASRLKPGPALAAAAHATVIGKAGEPGAYQGFKPLYNKNAGGWEQAREAAVSALLDSGLTPAPFLVQDLAEKGFDASRAIDYAAELAGGGVISRTNAVQTKKVLQKALFAYQRQLSKLQKIQNGANPLEQSEYDRRKQFFTDQYNAKVKRITEYLQKKAEKTQAPAKADFASPVFRKGDFK